MKDALVIGAGPAGSVVANGLADAGWSVAIVEKSTFPRRKVCGEYLSPTNYPVFEKLGLLDEFIKCAGPEIRRVGLFANTLNLQARMPADHNGSFVWGRALRREVLDSMFLSAAAKSGADVFQPWSVTDILRSDEGFVTSIKSKSGARTKEITSRVVIAAHGSWENAGLPTQLNRKATTARDLFGFKAHFSGASLRQDLMPMVVFPGGYGGMVTCDRDIVSISCCVRYDHLQEIRKRSPKHNAGDPLQSHIIEHCEGVREVLYGTKREGRWLTAGPVRPGIRRRAVNGIFLVGNAAGESHPIIAEGISMAIQSGWLLAELLTAKRPDSITMNSLRSVEKSYDKKWLELFSPRIRSAGIFAKIAMSNRWQAPMSQLLSTFPSILTLGAKMAGKARHV